MTGSHENIISTVRETINNVGVKTHNRVLRAGVGLEGFVEEVVWTGEDRSCSEEDGFPYNNRNSFGGKNRRVNSFSDFHFKVTDITSEYKTKIKNINP